MLKLIEITKIRPNNWFINREKLDKVRKALERGTELPPVLVTEIDAELALIDGHSRAFAAFERGETHVLAEILDIDKIEGSRALYEHIHREGSNIGVNTIADLASRIVEPDEHRRLWIGYCESWLDENEREQLRASEKARNTS
ncbi:MAG TPA: hypothetical protein ENN07_07505 [candidate division Zixibacteria bacterium]|nr:hypothetical protein [candidate division Zixibacteria bacterium]